MPKKKAAKPKKAAKKTKAPAKGNAKLVCAECGENFETSIALNNFDKEAGKKFSCPSCGAVYELISLLESRITVTILAKGETRTYGKTYDLSSSDHARPL
jgi:predicted RNA-binding Zn-ribbon protein involved in translation (DUF1610 family)